MEESYTIDLRNFGSLKNPPKFDQKSTKMAPKINKIGPKLVSWGVLGGSCCMFCFLLFFGRLFSPSGRHFGANLAPSWPQVGPSWGQVGSKMRHVGTKLAQVGAKVPQVGAKMDPTWASRAIVWRFQRMFKFVSIFQPILDRFFMVF